MTEQGQERTERVQEGYRKSTEGVRTEGIQEGFRKGTGRMKK